MAKKRKAAPSKQFAQRYFDPSKPTAYGGMTSFLKGLSPSEKSKARKWIESQDAYSLHKPFVRKFKRRKVIANFQDQLQADLVDLKHISKDNDRYRYLLTVIDVFSKRAFVEILRKKDTGAVSQAFEKILDRLGFNPRLLHTDSGTEFVGKIFQKMLKRRGIKYFSTSDSTIKCSIIERFNRSLMTKLYRYFTKQNSYRYLPVLQDIVQSYNNSPHSSTGFAPDDVSHANKERIWLRMYNSPPSEITAKSKQLKLGSFVRIAKRIKTFDKGYKSRWSGEVFRIYKIKQTSPTTYNLVDLLDENITGAFYEEELSPTKLPETYAVESILDSDKNKLLVKWRDYPPKFNSWIHKNSIGNI